MKSLDLKINTTQVLKNKLMRGQVLRTLTLFYPDPVSVGSLKSALLTRGITATAETINILHYLQDKGYLKMTEAKITDINDDDLVSLTAKGVDLMEGTIEDPGVEV